MGEITDFEKFQLHMMRENKGCDKRKCIPIIRDERCYQCYQVYKKRLEKDK